MKKRALITGVGGQTGSYLAEHLLQNHYDVFGIIRYSTSSDKFRNISHILSDVKISEGDITDSSFLDREIHLIKPHEIYNLASQSHVGRSFEIPAHTSNVTGMGVVNILEAVRKSGFNSKILQASTSEMFGNSSKSAMNEFFSFSPRSPYGCAKLYAHNMMRVYRESYGMFACTAISFNHESPRRGDEFVTKKIVKAVVRIKKGSQRQLELGNIDAKRDWGHAKDYARGMHLIMNHSDPDDFVLATGTARSVRDFLKVAFEYVDLDYEKYVKINPIFFRPSDIDVLVGDSLRARSVLGWIPTITFDELVKEMIDHEMSLGVVN